MEILFEQFIREKQHINNVSNRTIEGYRWAWRAFEPSLMGKPEVLKSAVVSRISALREKGLTAVSVNTYLRTLNTFGSWLQSEGHTAVAFHIPRLKEERKVVQAFNADQVNRLLAFSPVSIADRRAHMLSCLILDTGVRIDEALSLARAEVDYGESLVTIRHGKGGKQRIVPFSLRMRKMLFRYAQQNVPDFGDLLFFAGRGEKIEQRNSLRDLKLVCRRIGVQGVRCSWHTLRHTFAVEYLRNGGDVFRLQQILGHSKLEMTRRYVNLQTEDLQAVHNRFSVFAQRG